MRDLKVKMTETRDMLRSIDAVLRDNNEDVIQKALRESIFPLVEDGNGPGYWMDPDPRPHSAAGPLAFQPRGANDACQRHPHNDGLAGDCEGFRCNGNAERKGITVHEMDNDPFAFAVWEANTFFAIGRNDANEDGEAEDHGLDYRIINVTDDISPDYCDDCGCVECVCYYE